MTNGTLTRSLIKFIFLFSFLFQFMNWMNYYRIWIFIFNINCDKSLLLIVNIFNFNKLFIDLVFWLVRVYDVIYLEYRFISKQETLKVALHIFLHLLMSLINNSILLVFFKLFYLVHSLSILLVFFVIIVLK